MNNPITPTRMSDYPPGDVPPGPGDKENEKPPPFSWSLKSGAEQWVENPDEIPGLSDPPIIEGMLRRREVGTIVGPSKTSKTWFSLGMALKVAVGEDFLGHKTTKTKTLYLDYELKGGTFRKRMSMIAQDAPDNFHYQCLRGCPRLPTVEEITELIEAEGFGLVVVDSLYRTGWLSEENSNDAVSRELTALQRLTDATDCTIVAVDHTAKGGGAERSAVDASRGASAKGGFFDALMVLRPTDKGPEGATSAILDPVLRDWPRFETLPIVSFTWDSTACSIEAAGDVERSEADANVTKVLEAVADADKGMSIGGIAGLANLPESTARRTVKSLVAADKLVELADPGHKQRHIYRLPDFADEPRQTTPNPFT